MDNTIPILCCSACYQTLTPTPNKPHKDPNRGINSSIYWSFIQFCLRDLASRALFTHPSSHLPWMQALTRLLDIVPALVLTPEALANNPIRKDSPYIIHLQARVNFGPVVAHRYFLCPFDLNDDWVEISLVHFFAQGYPFNFKAMKWGVSCDHHVMFYQWVLVFLYVFSLATRLDWEKSK